VLRFHDVFEDELRHLLTELAALTGAAGASIVRPEGEGAGPTGERRVPLGQGSFLALRFERRATRPDDTDAAIERTVRALRACGRRWGAPWLPVVAVGKPAMPMRARIVSRIEAYLRALVNMQHATNAVLILRTDPVATATPLAELERERLTFLLKRLSAEERKRRGETSHAELAGDDFYAVSFWYGACLVVYFSAPFALDFVRHRARRVTHELSSMLPDLDDPPHLDPVQTAPLPD
jgi:hypothetical protein